MSALRAPFRVRRTEARDVPGIIALTQAVYPQARPWATTQLDRHREVFPEGQLVVEEASSGEIVGMAASLIVYWDDYDISMSWRDFTAAGTFTNHDPARGRTLYGAEIMVSPTRQGAGVGGRLYAARRELAERLGLLRIRAGARLRGYGAWASHMTPAEYVRRVIQRELTDRTLSFQLNRDFHVLDVVPGYLREDPESRGYAAVIEWLNPALVGEEERAAAAERFVAERPA